MKRILQILFVVLIISQPIRMDAQDRMNQLDGQKIKGVRYIAYPTYTGFPFLTEVWVPGKIEFTNGDIADSLFLRYSSFKDELLYYNKVLSTQIIIDKESIKGFSFTTKEGNIRIFRKQYDDEPTKGEHFFEVISQGSTDLVVWRKVILSSTMSYKDESNTMKDQAYFTSYQYYFYCPEKGYAPVKLNRNALLAEFKESDIKPIRKLLHKNQVRINDEDSFVLAWKIIERAGYKVNF